MLTPSDPHNRPALLVSVRDAAEALAALAGGADVIDVKEPSRGSLGAADASTIADVVRAVDGRAPVTAAMGELIDSRHDAATTNRPTIPEGVSLFKLGLAGCRENPSWPSRWRAAINRISGEERQPAARAVAVVYADWRTAGAPPPNDVLRAAIELGCPALLVDTCDKSRGTLFSHWRAHDLLDFVREVRSRGILAVLAGSLTVQEIAKAVALRADVLAFRTAACDVGRNGKVASERVQALKRAIEATSGAIFASPQTGKNAARF